MEAKKRRPLKLATVINWPDLDNWIWKPQPEDCYEASLIFASQAHDAYVAGRGRLPAYLHELYYLARLKPKWNNYDVVFAWELRTAIAVGLLRRLTGQRRAKFVALQPILKGPVLKALPLVRFALAEADRIVNFSRVECDLNADLLRLPRENFQFLPMSWPDVPYVSDGEDDFILAFGRSNRDYPLLLEAVRGTDLPVTILAGDLAWAKGLDVPSNVTLLANSHEELLLKDSAFWVVPLVPARYSSGQSVLLQGMARGKAVIITDGPAIRDYVRDGETAILVPPSDALSLRAAILRLWNDPEERHALGKAGAAAVRNDFSNANFTRALVSLAEDLVGEGC